MRRRFSTGNRGRNSLTSGPLKKVRRKMSLGSSLIINAESHGRPGWGGRCPSEPPRWRLSIREGCACRDDLPEDVGHGLT